MDSMLTGISCSCPCLCCVYKIDVIIICFIIYLLITRRIGQKVMMTNLTSFALPIVPEEERSDMVDAPVSQSDDQTMSTDSSRMPISSSSSTTSNSPSTSPDSSSHEQFSSTDHSIHNHSQHPGYMHRDSNSSLAPHSSSGISSIDMNCENESIKNATNIDMINPANTTANDHHLIFDHHHHNSRAHIHNYLEKYPINDNVMDSLTSCSSAYSTLKRKLIKPNIDLKLDSTESEDNDDEEEEEDQANGNNNNNYDIPHQHRRFSLTDEKFGPDNRHEDHHFYSLNYLTSPGNRKRRSKNHYYSCPKSSQQIIKSERNHKQHEQQQNSKNATPQFVYSDAKYHNRSTTVDAGRSKNSHLLRKHHGIGNDNDDDDDDRDEIMTDDSGPFSIDVKPSTHRKPGMEPLVLEAIEVNYNYDLSLSFRELRHIRKALARAELDSIGFARCVKEDIRRGKLCSACLKTKFRLFGPWPINCRLCERPVCSRCSTNVRISNQQYNRIPIKLLVPNRTMDSPIFNQSQRSPALSRSISTPTSGTSRCDYVGGVDSGGNSSSNRSTPSDSDRKVNRTQSTTASSMETDDELGHEDFESSSVSNSVEEEDEERPRTESRVSTDSRQSLAEKWSSSWSWLRRTSVHSLDDEKSFLALKMCLDCELFYHSIAQFK
ncbi:uncharacterized protein LOC141858615 [Brevipalpus obovatus]|uniref:uncharacterized protein LOC141858615 n=1 Tax=Brevipalpus obovatus TaxID=246614 RepID=UPI003D9EFBBF